MTFYAIDPCPAFRACGRHQCRRICCPLAALVNSGKKGRRRVAEDGLLGEECVGLHECDLVVIINAKKGIIKAFVDHV